MSGSLSWFCCCYCRLFLDFSGTHCLAASLSSHWICCNSKKKDLSSRCLFRWAESSDMPEVVNNRLWLYPRPCSVLLWSILQDDHFRVRKQAIFPIGNASFCFIIVPPILLDFLKSSSLKRTTFCTEIMKKCKGIAISRTNHLNTHNHHATSYWDILSLMP